MATVNIDSDIDLSALAYNAGDDLVIRYGAELEMTTHITKNPKSITCTTNGTFRIINSSSTTPIGLTLSTNTGDLRFEKNGIFEAFGEMIELTAGTGVASQTWDFSVSPLDRMVYPSYVEVETAVGSGIFEPWFLVSTAGTTITYSASFFSTSECGKVFFWNNTTKILSVGDGTNGNYLSLGQKVRIPNIVIHSAVNSNTPNSRTMLDLNPSGTANLEYVAFSNAIYIYNNSFKSVRMVRCGAVGMLGLGSANGDLWIDHFSLTPDTEQSGTPLGFQITNVLGSCYLQYITALITGATLGGNSYNYIIGVSGLTSLNYCKFGIPKDRDAAGSRPLNIGTMRNLARIENLVTIGGRLNIDDTWDCLFLNHKHADRFSATSTTSLATYIYYCTAISNIKTVNFSNAGAAAPRTALLYIDVASSGFEMYNSTYDCDLNTLSIVSAWIGSTITIMNCNFIDMVSNSGPTFDSPTTFLCDHLVARNIKATYVGTRSCEATPYADEDLVPGTPANFTKTFTMAKGHNSASLIDSGLAATTGSIVFAAFGDWSGFPAWNTLNGGAQYDYTGLVELPLDGDSVEFISPIYHSIVDFQNADPYFTYYEGGVQTTASTTPPSTMTVEFAITNPEDLFPGTQPLTAANLAGAIAALSGYDSDVGLQIQIIVTASGDDDTRNFGACWWFDDIDNTWVANDASITFSGADTDDIIRLKKYSDDSVIATFTGGGLHDFSIGSNFEVSAYVTRSDVTDVLICSTKNLPIDLVYGDNGTVYLYSGVEVQLANDNIWDYPLETLTTGEMMKVMFSALAGIITGATTSTINFRNYADTKNRIVATVDGTGNRTSVLVDGT